MIDEVKLVTIAHIPTGLSELLIDQKPSLFFRLEVRCHGPRSYQQPAGERAEPTLVAGTARRGHEGFRS